MDGAGKESITAGIIYPMVKDKGIAEVSKGSVPIVVLVAETVGDVARYKAKKSGTVTAKEAFCPIAPSIMTLKCKMVS